MCIFMHMNLFDVTTIYLHIEDRLHVHLSGFNIIKKIHRNTLQKKRKYCTKNRIDDIGNSALVCYQLLYIKNLQLSKPCNLSSGLSKMACLLDFIVYLIQIFWNAELWHTEKYIDIVKKGEVRTHDYMATPKPKAGKTEVLLLHAKPHLVGGVNRSSYCRDLAESFASSGLWKLRFYAINILQYYHFYQHFLTSHWFNRAL